ncbi:MAG: TlpA disulfide reductase family protein [Eubacteriales bacterium]|nr:TlpA disulfide reductase family protein [Eubacteriales bacterium]
MKFRTQKITALMAAAVLGISAFGSVPVTAAESTEAADAGEAMAVDGEAVSSDLVAGTFKPSDVTCKAQDSYEYPFLGLKLSLSKELLKQIKDQSIAMLTTEDFENQTNAVTYAYVSWSKMTEEQKNAEIQKMGTGYDDWVAGLDRIGTIGVYDEASQKKLDEITGCTEHKELGSSSDGKYKYYLSTNKDADEKLTKELEKIKTDITEMTPYQNISVFEQPQDTSVNPEDVKSVGKFETTGIDGKTYTEKVFSDYDLTLVNIFTTWCSPCVKEIPELQELYKEMKDKGVGVAGVVLDITDEKGNQDEEAVKKAGILQEKTKAEYPFLIPDTTMMNGRLQGISAFPETFFVDKDGNIVGDTYTGSHTLDEWKEIVEKELKNVSK